MAKGIREKIKLVSSAGTGHFYTTTKNKRTKPEKLELKKKTQQQTQADTVTEKIRSSCSPARDLQRSENQIILALM